MDSEVEQYLLRYIADEWRARRADAWAGDHEDGPWPWGAWIRLHAPLPSGVSEAITPVQRVWFLDERGLRERSLSEFMRFWMVQIERRWCTPDVYVKDEAFTGPRNRIGCAAFAEYDGTDEVYLQAVWGVLWGRGQQITVRQGAIQVLADLWRTSG